MHPQQPGFTPRCSNHKQVENRSLSLDTLLLILSGDDQPTCSKCDAVLTVKHILLDCPELRDVRLKYFTASSLKDIFESIDNQTFIDFIKDVNFYHQLYLLSAFYSSYSILVLFINHFFTDFTIILHFYFQSPSCYSIFMVAK